MRRYGVAWSSKELFGAELPHSPSVLAKPLMAYASFREYVMGYANPTRPLEVATTLLPVAEQGQQSTVTKRGLLRVRT